MGGNGKYFKENVGNAGEMNKFGLRNRGQIKNFIIFESEFWKEIQNSLLMRGLPPQVNEGFLFYKAFEKLVKAALGSVKQKTSCLTIRSKPG